MLTAAQLQLIADTCRAYGYDFCVALRTAVRDGVPYYIPQRFN